MQIPRDRLNLAPRLQTLDFRRSDSTEFYLNVSFIPDHQKGSCRTPRIYEETHFLTHGSDGSVPLPCWSRDIIMAKLGRDVPLGQESERKAVLFLDVCRGAVQLL